MAANSVNILAVFEERSNNAALTARNLAAGPVTVPYRGLVNRAVAGKARRYFLVDPSEMDVAMTGAIGDGHPTELNDWLVQRGNENYGFVDARAAEVAGRSRLIIELCDLTGLGGGILAGTVTCQAWEEVDAGLPLVPVAGQPVYAKGSPANPSAVEDAGFLSVADRATLLQQALNVNASPPAVFAGWAERAVTIPASGSTTPLFNNAPLLILNHSCKDRCRVITFTASPGIVTFLP